MRKNIWKTLACTLFCTTALFGTVGCGNVGAECSVTFDHNDGTGNVTVIKIPKGASVEDYAPVFIDGDRTIASWTTLEGQPFSGAVKKSIHLVGVWETYEEIVTKRVPTTITDAFVKLDMSTNDYVCETSTVTIANTVKRLSIVSSTEGVSLPEWNFVVEDRKKDLYLQLTNASFSSNTCAIDAINDETSFAYTLHVNVTGVNTINCASATSSDLKGADAIRAHKLQITGDKDGDITENKLVVTAGRGDSGESGASGGEGEHGQSAKSGGMQGGSAIVANTVHVENCTLSATGGMGGNGGWGGSGNNSDGLFGNKHRNGGNGAGGGNGGSAIETSAFSAKNAGLILIGGYGGNGGNGGSGGGSSKTFAGNGGNGGHGGKGGNVFANPILPTLENVSTEFIVGTGGGGGSGGHSASDSKRGYGGGSGSSGDLNILEE